MRASALLEAVFPPMLATGAERAPRDEEAWHWEAKYDGFRVLAGVVATDVVLWSRNALPLTARFPSVADALPALRIREAVLDGEVVALDEQGRSSFERLQRALPSDRLRYACFDLLWHDGTDLRARPIEERRARLEELLVGVQDCMPIALAERLDGGVAQAMRRAMHDGHEGLVGKRRGSRYEGRRSPAWLKLKRVRTADVVIVGYTPQEGQPRELGALLVAVWERGGLRYAGKVGTGFDAAQRRELHAALQQERSERPGFVGAPRMREAVFVRPRLVAEVRFNEWTRTGVLRQPSFRGLRPDKDVDETSPVTE